MRSDLFLFIGNHLSDYEFRNANMTEIVAELNVLKDVLSGVLDPDISNMWVIVDPLIGQRKIQAHHK